MVLPDEGRDSGGLPEDGAYGWVHLLEDGAHDWVRYQGGPARGGGLRAG